MSCLLSVWPAILLAYEESLEGLVYIRLVGGTARLGMVIKQLPVPIGNSASGVYLEACY
jgi:hypothetical protein